MLADEIEQQVERTFECVQKYFQRFRRNVEIVRHLEHWLAVDARDRRTRGLGEIENRGDRDHLAHE